MKIRKRRFCFWLVVLIIFSVVMVRQELTIYKLKKQYSSLDQKLKLVNMKKVELNEEMDMSKTDRYIESIAREKLRLIEPGDMLFIDKSRINKLTN